MTMKCKNKSGIIIGFIFLVLLVNVFGKQIEIESNGLLNQENPGEFKRIKTSGFWNLTGSPIFIDDTNPSYNWSKTADDNDWCSGSGSEIDPYRIENVIIYGNKSGNCIEIKNSNKYFIIKNCTLSNSGSPFSGIYLDHADNGIIENNTCSFNQIGIYIYYSDNITIHNNSAFSNTVTGIFIFHHCFNNLVSENRVVNNSDIGIGIHWYSASNNITRNTVIDNNIGIYLSQFSLNNIVMGNFVYNSTSKGVEISIFSANNQFFNNSFIGNLQNADDSASPNSWDNGTIGNYWDDYSGYDEDDDGIGDTSYIIPGSAGSVDNFPIWWDGYNVEIKIITPKPYQLYGKIAPSFIVEIESNSPSAVLNSSWYTINAGLTNRIFTINSTIDQVLWDLQGNGTVTIKFYANDSDSNIGFSEVTVRKSLYPVIYINSINSQTENYIVGVDAPEFNIYVFESELDSMWYSLNDGITNTTFISNTTINQQLWSSLTNGTVDITFYANDTVNRIGIANTIVKIDVLPPELNILSPITDSQYNATAPQYSLTIIDGNLDKFWYTLNNGSIKYVITLLQGGINQEAWEALASGSILISFYANDTLGNKISEQVIITKQGGGITPPPNPLFIYILVGVIAVLGVVVAVVIVRARSSKKRVYEDLTEDEKLKVDLKNLEARMKEANLLIEEALVFESEGKVFKAINYWEEAMMLLENTKAKAISMKPKIVPMLESQISELQSKIENAKVQKVLKSGEELLEIANNYKQNNEFNEALKTLENAKKRYHEAEKIAQELNLGILLEDIKISLVNIDTEISNLGSDIKTGKVRRYIDDANEFIKTAENYNSKKEFKFAIDSYEDALKKYGEAKNSANEFGLTHLLEEVNIAELKVQDLVLNSKLTIIKSFISGGHELVQNAEEHVTSREFKQAVDELDEALKEFNEAENLAVNFDLQEKAEEIKKIQSDVQDKILLYQKEIFSVKKLAITRGGDWKIEADRSAFYFKVKVQNNSDYVITNITIFLTPIPRALDADKDRHSIEYLNPGSYESPAFKLYAKESCVGDVIRGVVSFTDPKGSIQTAHIKPFEIVYVCNLLTPKPVTEQEYERKTAYMDKRELIFDCDMNPEEVERELATILQRNNFYVLEKSPEPSYSETRSFKGFAEGKYDKEDVALNIMMERVAERTTKLVINAMSNREEKVIDLLKDINIKCDQIKSIAEILKENTKKIDQIFANTENLEEYLKEKLASDFEKIKYAWQDYKAGKIDKKGLIMAGVKTLGKSFLKKLLSKVIEIKI